MSQHLPILPVLVPSLTAVYFLLAARQRLSAQRVVSVLSTLLLVGLAVAAVVRAGTGGHEVYRLGDWPAPYGIVLVLDRLSALMVLLTSVVGLSALLYAIHGWDGRGTNFHALFHFQLMGLNGAFLTGDVFNLFVFFEVLLIASYGLLLHGGGEDRARAGVHYVVYNLVASTLFVIALGAVYGAAGTLNMADLATTVPELTGTRATVLHVGALLLLVVFAVKAAVLPLYFWLPSAYASAAAPVAALFAVMTKVGVYALLRVFPLVFGPEAGGLAGLARPYLLPAGLATLAAATLGAVAAGGLRRMTAYLVVASVGTLLTAVGLFTAEALAAALYYLVHTTVVAAGLFLLAELVAGQRGEATDAFVPGDPVEQPALLGSLFFLAALAIAGLPPLSGFVGKVLVLRSALPGPETGAVFVVILVTGLLTLLALARAGSTLFWKPAVGGEGRGANRGEGGGANDVDPAAVGPFATGMERASASVVAPVVALLGLSALLVGAAGPVHDFARGTTAQLLDTESYVEAVLDPTGARVDPDSDPGGTHDVH